MLFRLLEYKYELPLTPSIDHSSCFFSPFKSLTSYIMDSFFADYSAAQASSSVYSSASTLGDQFDGFPSSSPVQWTAGAFDREFNCPNGKCELTRRASNCPDGKCELVRRYSSACPDGKCELPRRTSACPNGQCNLVSKPVAVSRQQSCPNGNCSVPKYTVYKL